MKITGLIWYLGMGCLAHWLWIGSHVDPSDVFTYVCLLLGPLMVLVWLLMKAAWWLLVVVALVVLGGFAVIFGDNVATWNRMRKRRRELDKSRRRVSL